MRIIFWNVHGYKNVSSINSQLKDSDVICLVETWATHQVSSIVKGRKNFQIVQQTATKGTGRGRPSGGSLIAFDQKFNQGNATIKNKYFNLVHLNRGTNQVAVCACYIRDNEDLTTLFSALEEAVHEFTSAHPNCPFFICGDFNSRVGQLNSLDPFLDLANCQPVRESKDHVEDKRGKLFCSEMEKMGFLILNGRAPGDIPAEYTYIDSKGCSTIDLFCCRPVDIHLVKSLKSLEIVSASDHDAIVLTLDVSASDYTDEKKKNLRWNPSKKDKFQKNMREVIETHNVDQLYSAFTEEIKAQAEKSGMYRVQRNHDERGNIWFDSECWEMKKKVGAAWRKSKRSKDIPENKKNLLSEYLSVKNSYKVLIKSKKVNKEARRIENLKKAKTGRAFWNSLFFRKKKKSTKNKISIERWYKGPRITPYGKWLSVKCPQNCGKIFHN